jgi:methylated-DNA-[protein]-cysteine S-methyltransferase
MGRCAVDTPLGRMVLTASAQGLTRIEWSNEQVRPTSNPHLDNATAWVEGYFIGDPLPTPTLDGAALTKFQFRVCTTLIEHAPYGKTTTYGDLARAAKSPGASRAVGSVMARQPWPLLVPCHRVLKSDGGLGNYSAADGAITKKWLLEHESQ